MMNSTRLQLATGIILVPLIFLCCCPSTPSSFSFIVTSDTHYAKRQQYPKNAAEISPRVASIWRSSESTFRDFLEILKQQVKETSPSPVFWLSTGDLVSSGHYGSSLNKPIAVPDMEVVYQDLLNDLAEVDIGVPLINAKGNNEAKGNDALSAYHKIFIPYMSKHLRKKLKTSNFSFDHMGSHFIILDEFPEAVVRRDGKLPFDLGDEQLDWLRADLEANRKAAHIFVFHHTPVIPPIPGSHIHFRNPEHRERYLELLLTHNVSIVFVGHNHSLSLLEYEQGDRSFVQVMANSRNLEKPEATYIRTAYNPADLKGQKESETAQNLHKIALRFAPNIKSYFFARHLPGHLIVTVERESLTIRAFLGTSQEEYRSWILSKDSKSGRFTLGPT